MSLKIDQAFIESFINANFGLEIAYQNLPYEPTANIPYAELLNIPNDITALDPVSYTHLTLPTTVIV